MSAPTGTLSTPIEALRQMIAASPAFQAWVDADDATEAAASVYVLATPKSPRMPFALIDLGDWARERITLNARKFQTSPGTRLVLYFRAEPLPPTGSEPDEPGAAFEFMNRIAAVIEDLEQRAGIYAEQTLPITEITLAAAPARLPASKRPASGDYYEVAFTLQWSRQP